MNMEGRIRMILRKIQVCLPYRSPSVSGRDGAIIVQQRNTVSNPDELVHQVSGGWRMALIVTLVEGKCSQPWNLDPPSWVAEIDLPFGGLCRRQNYVRGVLCRERCLFDTGRLNSISLLESITCPSMSAAGISGRARFVSSKGIPHEHIIISRSRLISSIFHSLQKP
ncbi:hypothetical protein K456DRAFT_283893 [Colletotrichum gloeosporioides 23]|nr:hypothetical protein K456DRAFT_283893 [Colletotrichum gloeosporioides 23]